MRFLFREMMNVSAVSQGLAFTLEERQVLGIHGLQPARFKTQEEQLELCKISINRYQEDLNKYLYLVDLQVRVAFYTKKYKFTLTITHLFITRIGSK